MFVHYPVKATFFCGDSWGGSLAHAGIIEGVAVLDILWDTSCSKTMIRKVLHVVPENKIIPREDVIILSGSQHGGFGGGGQGSSC